MATVIKPEKTIQLSDQSRIVLDFDGRLYRAAYYHPINNKSGQLKIARDTAKAFKIRELLAALLDTEPYSNQVRGIMSYIEATEWGANLP